MSSLLRCYFADNRGATAIENGLIATLLAVVMGVK